MPIVMLRDRLLTFNTQQLVDCLFSWYDVITSKSKQTIGCALSDVFFLKFAYFLIFLNIQIDLIILDADVEQFTLTTKKSLHIIFKACGLSATIRHIHQPHTPAPFCYQKEQWSM